MKVLTVGYNDLGISWGPAVHFLELWNEVAESEPGFEVVGIAPSWTGQAPITEPRFPLRAIKVPNWPSARQILWDFIVALQIAKAGADLVYIRLSSFHLFSLMALAFLRTPVASEINGSLKHDNISRGSGWIRRKIAELSERWLIKRSCVIFSVTAHLLESCRAVNPKALHVHVDNGVSRALFDVRQAPSERLRFIYVGTFTAWDGAAEIVRIAGLRPDLSFRMVGDGGRKRELEAGAPPNVEFSGWVDYSRLQEEYSQADAGIVLYEEERHKHISMSSLKTREFIAAGLPIFSTKVSGQEFIEECGYGLLTSGDVEADLQTFVERHGEYKRNLLADSASLFERYSWASVAAKTAASIRSILKIQDGGRGWA